MRFENDNDFEEVSISREIVADLDDRELDLLRQYFKIEESDDDKFLNFLKRNRPLPSPDKTE